MITVCVWLKGDFGEMYVVSVYCQYGKDIEPYVAYLSSVCEIARGKCLLIGMDANAVSPLWFSKGEGGSRQGAMRGRVLEEWITVNGINVLNEPCESYTFSGPNGESDIDVTLVNDACVEYQFEWEVKPDWGISDHNVLLIRMLYGGNGSGMNNDVCRWVWRDIDWDGYMSDLRESALEGAIHLMDEINVERLLQHVMSWILGVNDRRMKKYVRRTPRKLVWWTDELERMKRRVRKSRRVYQRARKNDRGVDEKMAVYKRTVCEYKKKLWKVKEDNWRRFVNEFGNEDPWGDVYRVCMGRYGKEMLSGMKIGDRLTSTWKESVDVLMERFFPAARMNVVRNVGGNMRIKERQFEWWEVDEAVKSMKLRKAPGIDGICTEMLRVIWRVIPEWLKRVYDACLSTMCFPVVWKTARVIVLLKSPDKVRSDSGSYRPICLLSVLGKVLERMMVKRMQRMVNDRMCDAQYGFVKGRSTEDAWNRVHELVNESGKKYVLGVFVDFQGAFDNLEWDCVLEKLREMGCEETGLWESYFSERCVCMTGVCETVWKDVRRGCPQGSICGPFIWNLMMDELLWRLREYGCKMVAYADDLLLIVEGQNRVELERKGTEWIQIVYEWGVRVSISESKTVMMLMKGGMSETRRPSVCVNGKRVKYVSSVKYLGIWVSERMNFKVHFESLRKKIVNVVGKLRRVMRKEWGLRKKALRVLYGGLFSACVMYGASVWYGAMKFGYARELMNRYQRVVLIACLNMCRTVSTAALQVLMGGLPWDLECVKRGVCFRVKRGLSMSEGDIVNDDEVCGKSISECRELVSDRLYDVWQKRWDECEDGRVTYGFIKNVRFAEECREFEPNLWMGYILDMGI